MKEPIAEQYHGLGHGLVEERLQDVAVRLCEDFQ